MCSISFVGVSSSVFGSVVLATFLIVSPFSMSFTVTLNSTALLSSAFNCTVIPFAKSSAEFPVAVSPTFILPFTKVVFVGIVSFTITSPGAVPSLLKLIV